jgi:hypothetical protein
MTCTGDDMKGTVLGKKGLIHSTEFGSIAKYGIDESEFSWLKVVVFDPIRRSFHHGRIVKACELLQRVCDKKISIDHYGIVAGDRNILYTAVFD